MAEATVLAQPGARDYEAIYILRPDIEPDAAAKISNRVSEVLARENAKLIKVESWGRRKLAYPVRKYRRGIYVYLRFHGETSLVAEFERNLRMQRDAVLKFMTIKIADEVEEEVEIAPEDVEFAAVEPLTEDEMDESREKMLGLVDPHDRRHSRDDDRDRDRDHRDRGDDRAQPAAAQPAAAQPVEDKAAAAAPATAAAPAAEAASTKETQEPEAKPEAATEQGGEEK